MTKLPVEQVRIGKGLFPTGKKSPAYGGLCANPNCDYLATERHHIVRRSHLGGPFDYVEIDGEPQPNICGLCWLCHNAVTEGKAQITWVDGCWYWEIGTDHLRPLDDALGLEASPPSQAESIVERGQEAGREIPVAGSLAEGVSPLANSGEAGSLPPFSQVSPGTTCPTCERRVPHPKKETSPTNVRQLNLGQAPADFVNEIKNRLDEQAEAWGFKEQPHHRLKVLDLALEFSQAVTGDAAQNVAKARPWAA